MCRIETERLVLRPPTLDDCDAFFEIFSDTETMAFWSTPPHANVAETRDLVTAMADGFSPNCPDFAVTLDSKVIGKAGCWQPFEVGYILNKQHWRQGYALEALRAVIKYFFGQTSASSLTADIDPNNLASAGLLTKLGFRISGFEKDTFEINGVKSDSAYFTLDRNSD
jgi:ribosomal-protein-alanine N-acetyltransferase